MFVALPLATCSLPCLWRPYHFSHFQILLFMNKVFKKHFAWLFLAAGLLSLTACHNTETTTTTLVKEFDYKVAHDWNELFLQVECYAAGYRPGPAPRALAYMGLSAYEACITGMPDYNSVASLYSGLSIPQAESVGATNEAAVAAEFFR